MNSTISLTNYYRNSLPVWLLSLLLFFVSPFVVAQEAAAPANGEAAADSAELPPPPPELSNPRATMETFLEAMVRVKKGESDQLNTALTALDLSEIQSLVRREKGEELAWTLLEVLDRTRLVVYKDISDQPNAAPYTFEKYEQGSVTIAKLEDGRWLFSKATVAALPAIVDGLLESAQGRVEEVAQADSEVAVNKPLTLRIREQIPRDYKVKVMFLELWQWLGILFLVVIGVFADKLLSVILRNIMYWWTQKRATGSFRDVSPDVLRPLGLMLMAGIWWGGLNLLSLPANVLVVLLVAAKFLASFAGVWGAYRLVDVISAFFREMASKTESKVDDMLIPLFSRMAKIFITVVGIVFIANNLNVNVTSLLAGLGIAGMAFALAAKDVVENLFGSITVLWDQPFVVGDWVVIGDIEGTVEQIGFRSTRVRTFYNSLISLPNSRLITAHVDNMGKRRYRRFSCRLGVAYDTPPERMESFCEGIREIVKIHPYTRKDYFHVYFNSYEANSLDIMVYVFFDVPDWAAELQERERLLLDILRLSKRIGVEFAYPTQTIYWKQASTDPVQPADGEFSLAMTQDDAFKVGRAEAEAIVRESTGLGVKPPHRPSGLGSGDGDGDGGEG